MEYEPVKALPFSPVIAGITAILAVVSPILTKPDVIVGLAQRTVLLAPAILFQLVTIPTVKHRSDTLLSGLVKAHSKD